MPPAAIASASALPPERYFRRQHRYFKPQLVQQSLHTCSTYVNVLSGSQANTCNRIWRKVQFNERNDRRWRRSEFRKLWTVVLER